MMTSDHPSIAARTASTGEDEPRVKRHSPVSFDLLVSSSVKIIPCNLKLETSHLKQLRQMGEIRVLNDESVVGLRRGDPDAHG